MLLTSTVPFKYILMWKSYWNNCFNRHYCTLIYQQFGLAAGEKQIMTKIWWSRTAVKYLKWLQAGVTWHSKLESYANFIGQQILVVHTLERCNVCARVKNNNKTKQEKNNPTFATCHFCQLEWVQQHLPNRRKSNLIRLLRKLDQDKTGNS